MFYHIQLNCIPRSGSHLLMSHILPRGYVELPKNISENSILNNYKGLSLIHNHLGEGIDLSRFQDDRKVVNVILKRNYFMSAISLLVSEYTNEYRYYSEKKFDEIVIPPERVEEIISGFIETFRMWKKFKHERIAKTVILDYGDLVNNRWRSIYDRLNVAHEPIHPGLDGLGSIIDTVRKSPNRPSQIVSNYKELKKRYKHFLT